MIPLASITLYSIVRLQDGRLAILAGRHYESKYRGTEHINDTLEFADGSREHVSPMTEVWMVSSPVETGRHWLRCEAQKVSDE